MSSINALNDVEKQVYFVIKRATEEFGGVFQTELKNAPELKDLQPKQILQIVNKLVKLNLVKRSRVLNNGRSMYFLRAVLENAEHKSVEVFNLILEIPCFRCRNLYICGEGRSFSPTKCNALSQYLLKISKTSA